MPLKTSSADQHIFDSLNALVYVADMESHELLFMNKFGIILTGKDWKGKKCHEVLNLIQQAVCLLYQ